MEITNTKLFIKKSLNSHSAICAFNVVNFETLKAVIQGAEQKQAPVICQISEGALRYIDFDYFVPMALAAAKKATVPVLIHLDHSHSIALCKRAIDAGFHSVMFDGSNLSLAENIKKTKIVLEYARQHNPNVAVEGEIGIIGGKEDGHNIGINLVAKLADIITYYQATKVDWLAVAFGTSHGVYKGKPKLNFELLKKVNTILQDVPLVMHGTSGIAFSEITKALNFKIRKVNIGTELLVIYHQSLLDFFRENEQIFDLRKFNIGAINSVANRVSEYLDLLNSKQLLNYIKL